MDTERVLVVGGGIAGTATALGLQRAGFEPVVFEGHPDSGEDIGAFLALARNGTVALSQLGAAKAVARAGFALHTLEFAGNERALEGYRCLRRAELSRVLQAEAVRRRIPVHHGKRLVSATEDADGVTARFTDSGIARGDLLIGADGLNSTVRGLICPGAAPRYAGQQVFYGYSRQPRPPCEPGRMVMVRGSAVAFGFAVSPTGETSWFARVDGEELPASARPGPHWRERLLELLRPDDTPCADIVAATRGPLLGTNARDLPGVRRWRTRRMLVIGDAAHAASPATGQGASMALEDAVVLAKAMRDTENPLEAYERLRRPRVEHNIAASARMTARLPPPADPPPVSDDELARQLDWSRPLELSGR
ncbi:FAD-dependent monooxygenase [Amycolatopsis acidiphila]|uniref:FAD-dependent monooxygenase n=1 Tax=Amycolatopsis acidiphila TaxID=715473 RepID=A0A558AAN3_9PSEU|nr:NAD(P)/FAD-dependent oxidoreductase [Amycolatopsis acidiphila]TVT21330.1 FAD-dependent monooxygenase [Amycolatopsis acidiphila]UIJ63545.1 FAD-dependent monooxygenase [Amycolatopsis acidiphila]GHG68339.1 FAD-dependent oxidoreductase [Amycolatopsis acidiphila]